MTNRDPVRAAHVRIIRHELSFRSLLSIVAVGASLWLLVRIWPIMLLLIIALILAGTLSPLVAWLERHRVPRMAGLGLILVVLIVAVAGLAVLVIPAFVAQVSVLIANAPSIQQQLADYLAQVPALRSAAEDLRGLQADELLAPLGGLALGLAGTAAQGVVLAVTVLVLTFYLLGDHQRVKGFTFALVPRRFHLRLARILLDMETVVGGYVRGQALTSVLIGLVVFGVCWVAGVPGPLPLALIAAFADLIPFVGGAIVLIVVVLATLPLGLLPVVGVALAIFGYLQVENHLLMPRIYGQQLRLSPLAVVIALLIGGELLGMVGALLALPVAAVFRVLVEQLRIDLPGEQPGELDQHTRDAVAEADYAVQTVGMSALSAADLATDMAGLDRDQAVSPDRAGATDAAGHAGQP